MGLALAIGQVAPVDARGVPESFADLADHIVFPAGSHGKLGGKAAGMILARGILRKAAKTGDFKTEIRFPRSFYVTTDGLMSFISHNDLEDMLALKYEDIDEIRREYPNIQQLMKSSPFPPDMINGLTAVLDELGDTPVIVRSSSGSPGWFSRYIVSATPWPWWGVAICAPA